MLEAGGGGGGAGSGSASGPGGLACPSSTRRGRSRRAPSQGTACHKQRVNSSGAQLGRTALDSTIRYGRKSGTALKAYCGWVGFDLVVSSPCKNAALLHDGLTVARCRCQLKFEPKDRPDVDAAQAGPAYEDVRQIKTRAHRRHPEECATAGTLSPPSMQARRCHDHCLVQRFA